MGQAKIARKPRFPETPQHTQTLLKSIELSGHTAIDRQNLPRHVTGRRTG